MWSLCTIICFVNDKNHSRNYENSKKDLEEQRAGLFLDADVSGKIFKDEREEEEEEEEEEGAAPHMPQQRRSQLLLLAPTCPT